MVQTWARQVTKKTKSSTNESSFASIERKRKGSSHPSNAGPSKKARVVCDKEEEFTSSGQSSSSSQDVIRTEEYATTENVSGSFQAESMRQRGLSEEVIQQYQTSLAKALKEASDYQSSTIANAIGGIGNMLKTSSDAMVERFVESDRIRSENDFKIVERFMESDRIRSENDSKMVERLIESENRMVTALAEVTKKQDDATEKKMELMNRQIELLTANQLRELEDKKVYREKSLELQKTNLAIQNQFLQYAERQEKYVERQEAYVEKQQLMFKNQELSRQQVQETVQSARLIADVRRLILPSIQGPMCDNQWAHNFGFLNNATDSCHVQLEDQGDHQQQEQQQQQQLQLQQLQQQQQQQQQSGSIPNIPNHAGLMLSSGQVPSPILMGHQMMQQHQNIPLQPFSYGGHIPPFMMQQHQNLAASSFSAGAANFASNMQLSQSAAAAGAGSLAPCSPEAGSPAAAAGSSAAAAGSSTPNSGASSTGAQAGPSTHKSGAKGFCPNCQKVVPYNLGKCVEMECNEAELFTVKS